MQHNVQHLTSTTSTTVLSTPLLAPTNSVLVLTDAVVARGQRAWHRIKATAAEQRELWREVGEALLVGRRMHKSNQAFSQWCKDNGFDMAAPVRSDAMWFAESYTACNTAPVDMSHPTHLRQWAREQQHTALLPADLSDIQAETTETVELDERAGEKVAKLIRRAQAGDEGSAIAKRHVDALAKKHNTTVEKLEEAASIAAPATFFRFNPQQLAALQDFRETVMATVEEMEKFDLTREAIAAVFINAAKMIRQSSLH